MDRGVVPTDRMIREGIVLIVDDEPMICEEISEFLTLKGFRNDHVTSAADAIEMLERRPVSVVFTDIDMPGAMNGIGLAHWVHKHRPDTRVILTSGKFPWISASSPIARVPFMPKPVSLDKLVTVLRPLVREAEAAFAAVDSGLERRVAVG